MKKYIFFIISLLSLFALSGCATHTNITLSAQRTQQIVEDTTNKIFALYPAAKTTLSILEKNSQFNQALTDELRKKGFAVLENPTETAETAGTTKINYVIDRIDANSIRLSLKSNDRLYSKAYLFDESGKLQQTPWNEKRE